jgi:FAD/FMN-containing dehydrogenase
VSVVPYGVDAQAFQPDPQAGALVRAREIAAAHGGWLLREAGGEGVDGFGRPLPNLTLMRRIKTAFDPTNKCNPGRLPL